MNKASRAQLATVQELVACVEDLEELWPDVSGPAEWYSLA
jgi:hypothetical protein